MVEELPEGGGGVLGRSVGGVPGDGIGEEGAVLYDTDVVSEVASGSKVSSPGTWTSATSSSSDASRAAAADELGAGVEGKDGVRVFGGVDNPGAVSSVPSRVRRCAGSKGSVSESGSESTKTMFGGNGR